MDPFTIMALVSTAASAGGQILAGRAQKDAAMMNAYNLETERTVSQAEALQRHNDRLEQYRSNLSANIAAFSAMGRDVSQDRSVAAFLERQKEIASDDTRRSDFMGMMESMKLTSQAAAVRSEGKAAMTAAYIGAFTTLGQGIYNAGQTMSTKPAQLNQQMRNASSSGGGSSGYAPTRSIRPQARPW